MNRPNTPEDSGARVTPAADIRPGLARRAARLPGMARAGLAVVASGSVAGALFLASPALAAPGHQAATPRPQTAATVSYSFTTLDNQADPTFNQLLGINNHYVISGYFGSGAAGHPNKGYLLNPPYAQANYVNENFPNSAQTQVTGLNNAGNTSGFWVDNNGTNHGFVEWNGVFASYNDPKTPNMKGSVNQLLGINGKGIAVGFYNDAAGHSHAYEVNQATSVFTAIKIPGAVSSTATGINKQGDIVGFATDATGTTSSWLMHNGQLTTFQFPGGSNTQAFGVNTKDQIVGSYTDGGGVSHGFLLSDPLGPTSHWQTIDDPNGVGSTVVNGINTEGDLVGFYTDAAGNTHGMLATPNTVQLHLYPMPAGTAAFGQDAQGNLTVALSTLGLTPGSAHTVQLLGPDGSTPLAQFGTLTANSVGQAAATLNSTFTGSIPSGSRLVILNGTQSDSVFTQLIDETVPLSGSVAGKTYHLIPVEVSPSGSGYVTPSGHATVTYDPAAQTLKVTVTASGVSPGMHAAHIHLGSCMSQGPVQYMLMDLVANSAGNITNQTRVITGVTTPIPTTGWYLNLHQGNSNNILQNGQPTIFFRPLLCSAL